MAPIPVQLEDDDLIPHSSNSASHGSPISMCRCGNCHLPGSSPSQLSTLDPTDLWDAESNSGSVKNRDARSIEREDELCRAYTCCGLNLQNIHVLMEHFEEYHVIDIRGHPYPRTCLVPPTDPEFDIPHSAQDPQLHQQPQPQLRQLRHPYRHQHGPLDPDDLKLSSSAPSSASFTSLTTSLEPRTSQRAFANASSFIRSSLSRPSSACLSPAASHTGNVLPLRASTSNTSACSQTQHSPFSTYSAHYNYVSPLQPSQQTTSASGSQPDGSYNCVPPTLLYSPSAITPANAPSSSRIASPATIVLIQVSDQSLLAQPSNPASSLPLSNTLCCPMPNCNKSYRQVNELEHHTTYSHNKISRPNGLEARQNLFAERGVTNGNSHLGAQAVKAGLHELERATKRRPRSFACGVGDCQQQCKNMNSLRYHYRHSGDHDTIGLQLLASGQHECLQYSKSIAATCQSTLAYGATTSPSRPSSGMSTGSQSRHYSQGFGQPRYSASDVANSRFSAAQEQVPVPASLPDPLDKLLSDHVQGLSPQYVDRDMIITPSSSTQQHDPISQASLSRIRPDKLHPTLSCWIKNINKQSSLILHLQELASSAPADHRPQLLRHVVALRTTFKKQRQHCMEFLTLSEECANRYLLDISTEIQRQSSFLDKLEGRLEAANKLRREVVDLKMLYESGTVATMKDFRVTGLSRPLPEDNGLFSEVDLALTEIGRCYAELVKFWTEEIFRAMEALETHCVDASDFERWKNFRSNLKQSVESWKNDSELPNSNAQTVRCNNACSSKETDIGAIAFSLSSAVGLLTSALDRLPSSNSLKYLQSGRSSIQPVYIAFAANSDLCLSFLRRCADYAEKMFTWCLPSIVSPTSLRVMASHDLWERTISLRSEVIGVSVENAPSAQASRKFKDVYNKAVSLEQKTTSGLNALLEELQSWVSITNGPVDVLPELLTPEQICELSCVWAEARNSVRAALLNLASEPASRLFYRSSLPTSTRRSVMRRWVQNLIRFHGTVSH